MVPVAALLIGATVGLHLEQKDGLELEEALSLASELAARIEAASGHKVVLDDPDWSECSAADRCLPAIFARTRADQIVMVRLIAGLKLRLIAERFTTPPEAPSQRAEETSTREPERVFALLDGVARRLFPEGRASPALAEAAPAPVEERPFPVLAASVGGASVVAGVIGLVLGLGSESARRQAAAERDRAAFEPLADGAVAEATAANVLLTAALIGLGGAAALLVLD